MRISGFAAIAALGLLLPAASAFAADSATPAPQNDPDQIVCRAGQPVTGTRLGGGRVCHSQKEWDQIQRDAQDALTNVQTRSGQSNLGGS